MSLKPKIAIVLAALSAVALILGTLVLPWWVGDLDVSSFVVDLRSLHLCRDGNCGSAKALARIDPNATAWAKMGVFTMACSLVAAILLLITVIRLMKRQGQGTMPWLTSVFSLLAGILGVTFAMTHPSFGAWTPTWGMACTISGAFVGAVATSVGSAAVVSISESS